MRILLTGAGGMVGRAVADALYARTSHDEVLAPLRADLDLLEADVVSDYLAQHSPDVVIHAAAKVGGIASNVADPFGYLHDNLAITQNVIGGAVQVGIPRLLNFGTSCMYPRDWRQPLVESDLLAGPLEPTNEGYALAKLAAERLCRYASERPGFAYRTVMASNLYGPHDHFEPGRAHMIAAAIAKVHHAKDAGAPDVEVWGDGTVRREFTFVEDVAAWVADIVPRIEGLPPTVNIGCGVDYTVREFYEAVARTIGYDGELTYNLDRPVGMRHKLMDSSLAASYGWKAPTALADGLAQTYEWYLRHIGHVDASAART